MTSFRITSRAGVGFGVWEGATKAEALAKLHREAGYECRVEDDDVVFDDEDTKRLCGHVADWHFDEIDEDSALEVVRSDQGDGGWSIHIEGDEDPGNWVLSGPSERADSGEWARPHEGDFMLARDLIREGKRNVTTGPEL